jgi:hypothetical protein
VIIFGAGAAILSWVLSAVARHQQRLVLTAPAQAAADLVRANFSGVGWRRLDGRGMFNFQARGFGVGG